VDWIAGWEAQGATCRVLPLLLPVATFRGRGPQLFKTVEEWRNVADSRNISFVQAAIEYEKDFSGWTEQQIWDYFEEIYQVLYNQVHSLDGERLEQAKDTPMLPVYGKQWDAYLKKGGPIVDSLTNEILKRAFATNAKLPGVKIVPGPMGTGGGYLFSAIDAVAEARHIGHQKVLESLVVAAALGAIAYTHSNASAQSGCCGESGVCNAMGSGAVAWLCGGDGYAVEHAASMAMQANLGLYCDAIPGGLEFPCLTRTFRAAITAPLYADLALAGIDPLVPYHETLQVLDRNYHETPAEKLFGPRCGICTSPTAQKCMAFLSGEVMNGKLKYEA
jgi:L-serine dehydratase